jgi:arylsulfatase A-like enzyme
MFAFGPDFKKNVTSFVPVNMLDVMATILHLYGIESDDDVDGRIIREMFLYSDAVDPEKIPVETRPYYAENGSYKAVLMMTRAQGKRYLDKGWRMR